MLFHVSDDAHRGINPIWVKLKKKTKKPAKIKPQEKLYDINFIL